ncbi:DUF6968 family protein [Marinobacter qingdaonensis]|uniref:DUF6968 domain-containing protein n=1 Tax=Marinobacter qingdaonensis TaxID=3108486 RepID=A0ABU5NWT0_9GAMM|nr:hypothetical protein [Marinobacter sp. ASW11-75]MEA1080265.1 hypothetical protein [Marinobacter sp. ASW11-75]
MEYIAQRHLEAVKPSGERTEVVVAVGVPQKDEGNDSWACPVLMKGLHENLAAMHGIDSWQALKEAQKLVLSILVQFIEDGGKLYIFGEEAEVTLSEIYRYF